MAYLCCLGGTGPAVDQILTALWSRKFVAILERNHHIDDALANNQYHANQDNAL
jgi:hypothetical protein